MEVLSGACLSSDDLRFGLIRKVGVPAGSCSLPEPPGASSTAARPEGS
jgi:hypothetical protein